MLRHLCIFVLLGSLLAARAAESGTPLLFANTAAADRWLDSGCWDARGLRIADGGGADGLLVADLVHRTAFDPWYGAIHAAAVEHRQGE